MDLLTALANVAKLAEALMLLPRMVCACLRLGSPALEEFLAPYLPPGSWHVWVVFLSYLLSSFFVFFLFFVFDLYHSLLQQPLTLQYLVGLTLFTKFTT